jgi:hypothetical protein
MTDREKVARELVEEWLSEVVSAQADLADAYGPPPVAPLDSWDESDRATAERLQQENEALTWLLALLKPEGEPVAWEHEYACGHREVEAGNDPAPWNYCPWECDKKFKASRPLVYGDLSPPEPSREREAMEKIVNCLRWVDAVMDGKAAKEIPEHKDLSEEVRETLGIVDAILGGQP